MGRRAVQQMGDGHGRKLPRKSPAVWKTFGPADLGGRVWTRKVFRYLVAPHEQHEDVLEHDNEIQ